jgi:hypothetical protein
MNLNHLHTGQLKSVEMKLWKLLDEWGKMLYNIIFYFQAAESLRSHEGCCVKLEEKRVTSSMLFEDTHGPSHTKNCQTLSISK